jgi:Protein of unknown function (DUF3048) N-terminal domain/Protein of unknown function (DUF3048) C-terminal domain
MTGRRWTGGRAGLGAALLGAAIVAAACGGGNSQSASTTTAHEASPAPTAAAATCPLTGQPAPNGKVPQRPALAVKVDNAPAARPQYGLGTADVVYEQPVEGGLTRYIAIFQCHDAGKIMPIRSGRLIDPELLSQFGAHPLFAYSGAIDPVIAKVRASPLIDVGANEAPSAYTRDTNRSAPHNLFSSTDRLYAAGAARGASKTPPEPVFHYGSLPSHRSTSSVNIAYSASNVTWTWESGAAHWSRSYRDTGPATLGGGGQIATANIVVMKVVLYPSPYVEDATGARENLLRLTGSGEAQVFRNGAVIDGRWERPKLSDTTELVNSSGQTIPLTPGQTWIELVPTTVNVTVRP